MYIGNDLQIAHPSYKIIDDISSGFNGSATSFALQVSGETPVPFPISTQQVMISVNGVVQEPDPSGSAGFKLLGSNIVFSSAPANGHAFFGVINAGADYVTAGSEFPDGSATAPSFTFQDDQDTGWFRSGSGAVGYSANGVQTLTFDGNGLTVTGDASFVGDSAKNLLWDKSDGQLEFADNAKAVFGTGSDLQLYHDGTNSHLKNLTGYTNLKSANGALYIDGNTTHIRSGDGGETQAKFIDNGAVELYHNGLKTLYTDSLGFSVKGGDTSSKTQLSIWGNEGQRGVLQISADDGDDNADHWQFQARTDGNLNIQNLNSGSWGNSAVFEGGGAVKLYHNNVKKFETTSAGATVTGTLLTDVLTIYDSTTPWITVGYQSGQDHRIQWDSSKLQFKADPNNDGNNSQIVLNVDNSDKLIINKDGEFGIGGANYGTSGQVLTSGGTGSAASWTSISAAPEVTGTATGTIATGGAVVGRSDGNFETVTGVASGLGSGINNYYSGTIDSVTSCKLSDGHIVVIYQKQSNNQAYTKVGTVSGSGKNSTISWSSVETNLGVSSPSVAGSPIVMIPLSGSQDAKVAVAYRWSNRLAVKIGRITGSGTTKECEFGSGVYMEHGGQNYQVGDFDICWSGSSRYLIACFARTGGSTRWNVSRVVVPSSGYSISVEAKGTDVTSGDWHSNRIVWSPDENRALCFATNNSGIVKMSVGTPTSNDMNVTGEWSLNTSSNPGSSNSGEEGQALYDTSSNKVFYTYIQENVRHICGFVITMNGTSQPSKGSLLTKTDFGTNTTDEFDYLSMAYDSDNNKINIQCNNKTTGGYKHIIGAISGTSFSGTLYTLDSSTPREGGGTVADYGSGLFGHTFNKGSSSSALKFYQLPSSNLTTGNFIGFASAGVSNGETVTVKVTGNTLSTSGLTPGSQYFVDGDGSLSTTAYSEAEVKAGIALASNKLLIRQ